ncbi:pilus assembly protein TadG-related protein [Pelagibacterium sp.]|uniref:pilus assembly protein TadG-related protein n=1 Tax=Pelagibacterium sp. TaxID=1967288 RepID=UPI003A8EE2E2
MGRSLWDLVRREDGAVAVIFAVMAIPFIAMAGWAVDYVRLQHVKEFLQAQVDAAALSAFVEEGENWSTKWELVESVALAEISRQYQGAWAQGVSITPDRFNDNDLKVTASAQVPLAFMNILPGVPDTQLITVSATVQFSQVKEVRRPPDTSLLDPVAGDFNRIWMYCFWPNRPENDPDLPRRTRMVPVADNGGSVFLPDFSEPPTMPGLVSRYTSILTSHPLGLDGVEQGPWLISKGANTNRREYQYMWPDCAQGSFLSFRLENVRFARTQQRYWDSGTVANNGGDRKTGRFSYYTDTFFTPGNNTEQYAGLQGPEPFVRPGEKVDILETVLCDSIDECRPQSEGGVIPEGVNRSPQRATGKCEPGKYMYYGWEDRPPGLSGTSNNWQHIGWTDRDYDDIRIIIQCPTFETVGERNARLVE